jgi:hypothetical protein
VLALLDSLDAAGRVDVALHEVSVEAVADAQRQLEVHLLTRGEGAEVGAVERLLHHVCLEAVAVDLDRRQADAVDGDRVAAFQLTREWRLNDETCAGFLDATAV